MEYVLKITTNHAIEIIEKPERIDYKWYAKQIGCEWIELVRSETHNVLLVIDEEGKFKTNKMNVIASALYGTYEHGDPIVGDALIVNEGMVNGEHDIVGFSFEEIMKLKNKLEHDKLLSINFQRLMNGI